MAHAAVADDRVRHALRKQAVEPALGIIRHVRGWRRIGRRGLAHARGKWSLVALV